MTAAPTHLAWTTAGWEATVHVVVDGPLTRGRIKRQPGDALCKPADRLPHLTDGGPPLTNTGTCPTCAARRARLVGRGLIEHPCGRTAPSPIPTPPPRAPSSLLHDPDFDGTCPRCGGSDYGPFTLPNGDTAADCMDCNYAINPDGTPAE